MAASPSSWFKLTKDELEIYLAPNSSSEWPFTNLTKSCFLQFWEQLQTTQVHAGDSTLQIYASLLGGVGVLLTVPLLMVLYRKAVMEKSNFYRAMMLISSLDLVFCLVDMFYNIFYRGFKINGSTNFEAIWFMLVLRGFVYSCSLCSDMCTVVLTVERYLAVTKPQLHKKLSDKRRIIKPVVFLVIILLTSTRLHYSMEKSVIRKNSTRYYYADSALGASSFVSGLATIGDAVLPIVLLVSMLVFSTLFLTSVMKRRQQKLQKRKQRKIAPTVITDGVIASNMHQQLQKQSKRLGALPDEISGQNEMKSMLTLTLALDALFLLNQLGYCIYLVSQQLHHNVISYQDSYQEIADWVLINRVAVVADAVCVYLELLSHGLNFPLYLALTKSTRVEFVKIVNRFSAMIRS